MFGTWTLGVRVLEHSLKPLHGEPWGLKQFLQVPCVLVQSVVSICWFSREASNNGNPLPQIHNPLST